jgi:DNA modification methylase
MTVTIRHGDCREVLRTMPDESVHCCVTSPPYFGLRDYGVAGQIGLEPSPELFVDEMVAVFREVRRVLRDDGTLWLNLGDSYANDGKWGGHTGGKHIKALHCSPIGRNKRYTGLKAKDLIGIPWMVAFALRADGWYLRRDIIWHKLNPMPESVRDRPSTAHEYLFLLTKSERYYYDADSIMEASSPDSHARAARGRSSTHKWADGGPGDQTIAKGSPSAGRIPGVNPKAASAPMDGPRSRQNASFSAAVADLVPMRNKRSVWATTTEPFSEAHFATFPPSLVEPCILAGSPAGGTVLDPFGGAGTTAMVADRLQRDAILIELNPAYSEIAERRINNDAGMFAEVSAVALHEGKTDG